MATPHNNKPFRLLDLPRELRLEIYQKLGPKILTRSGTIQHPLLHRALLPILHDASYILREEVLHVDPTFDPERTYLKFINWYTERYGLKGVQRLKLVVNVPRDGYRCGDPLCLLGNRCMGDKQRLQERLDSWRRACASSLRLSGLRLRNPWHPQHEFRAIEGVEGSWYFRELDWHLVFMQIVATSAAVGFTFYFAQLVMIFEDATVDPLLDGFYTGFSGTCAVAGVAVSIASLFTVHKYKFGWVREPTRPDGSFPLCFLCLMLETAIMIISSVVFGALKTARKILDPDESDPGAFEILLGILGILVAFDVALQKADVSNWRASRQVEIKVADELGENQSS